MVTAPFVSPEFEVVRNAFAHAHEGADGIAQLCIYAGDACVVDLAAGADRSRDDDGPLVVLMSCTKGALSIGTHMLASAGEIDLDGSVADYWPDFAAGGKHEITLRQVLSHQVGLLGFEPAANIRVEDYANWERCSDALSRMEPLWKPGTAYAYHFATFGFILGEVISRVTGKSPGQFFADQIAGPLGLEMWIGLPERDEHRVIPQTRANPTVSDENAWRATLAARGVDIESRLGGCFAHSLAVNSRVVDFLNTRAGHAAEIPSLNGIGTAHALARMYAACITSVSGTRLLDDAAVDRARLSQTDDLTSPPVLQPHMGLKPQRFGLGFQLSNPSTPMLGEGSFGHAGIGGQIAFANPESGVAAAYVSSAMVWDGQRADPRWVGWSSALREVLQGSQA
jgi:CubicO group peptidase (beta-lactamase class C family)